MDKKNKYSLEFVAFFQALGLTIYCGLVALFMWQANQWFGKMPNYLGPLLLLIIFTTSALICALITLSYPFVLWQEKKLSQALKLIIYTALWLIFFTFVLITTIFLFR